MEKKMQEELNKYVRNNNGDPLQALVKRLVDIPKDELEKLVIIAANRLILAHMGRDGYENPLEAAKGIVLGLQTLLAHYDEAKGYTTVKEESDQTENEFKVPDGFSWGGHGIC